MAKHIVRNYPEFRLTMGVAEVAVALDISPSSAYRLMHRADFPSFRIGRSITVSREKFIEWVNMQ